MGRQLKTQRSSKKSDRAEALGKSSRPNVNNATESEDDDDVFMDSHNETDTLYAADPVILKQIPELYDAVAADYWARVDTDGYQYFCPEDTCHFYNFELDPEELFVLDDTTEQSPIVKYRLTGEKEFSTRATLLSELPIYPTMRYWTHTNVNIIGQSEFALSHLPYLGDEISDSAVVKDLLETYDEGIHGQTEGCGNIINDYLLFHLVDRILKKNKLQNHGNDLVRVMSSIYQEFPNKNSARDLVANYPDLVARFDPANAVKRTVLYNEFGEFNDVYPVSSVLSSTVHLLCKRCGTIDCIYHPPSVTVNDVHIERDGGGIGPGTIPCGQFCYRHFEKNGPKSPKKVGQKRRHSSGPASPTKATAPVEPGPEWTPHEKTLMNTIMAAKLTSICRVTQVFSTLVRTPPKTCKQVYDYIQAHGPFQKEVMDPNMVHRNKRTIDYATHSHHRTFRSVNGGKLNNNKPYRSCYHDGECSTENGCSCRFDGIMCTKYCGCPTDCQVRFPGCRCKPGNCRKNLCQCYYAGWECDPDLCADCNCQITDDSGLVTVCRNVNIQRGYQRKLYISESEVAGIGCFAAEPIPKGEFIGEYVGEIITQDEAERRGKVYDKFKCSYLFSLNDDQAVDATRVGNVVRFVNHSTKPNCFARVIVVSGDHHIGLFAQQDIAAHEELFFDYSYNKSQLSQFVYIERKCEKARSNERISSSEASSSSSD